MKSSGKNRAEQIEAVIENFHSIRRRMLVEGCFGEAEGRITHTQWRVLSFITGRPETALKDIAQALGITSSAATQLVDGLVEGGYITRKAHQSDRRVTVLALAPKAAILFSTIQKKLAEKMTGLFAGLTDEELNLFVNLSRKMLMSPEDVI